MQHEGKDKIKLFANDSEHSDWCRHKQCAYADRSSIAWLDKCILWNIFSAGAFNEHSMLNVSLLLCDSEETKKAKNGQVKEIKEICFILVEGHN